MQSALPGYELDTCIYESSRSRVYRATQVAERVVRDTVARLLEALGYEVLKAEFPSKAIELCKVAENRIDLLLTDVVMAEMSGPKLKEELDRIRPGMKVLFMSGYTNNVIVHHGVLEACVQLIQKPVTRKDLATKVAYLLGSSEPARADDR